MGRRIKYHFKELMGLGLVFLSVNKIYLLFIFLNFNKFSHTWEFLYTENMKLWIFSVIYIESVWCVVSFMDTDIISTHCN